MKKNEDTIFDQIKRGDHPAEKVYEDDNVLAFKDINAVAPVHILIIPKKKLTNFSELVTASGAEIECFMRGILKVVELLKLDASGYRVVFNCGAHGQQTIPYMHAHLIGGRQMMWPPG